jgi:hypothetical protein
LWQHREESDKKFFLKISFFFYEFFTRQRIRSNVVNSGRGNVSIVQGNEIVDSVGIEVVEWRNEGVDFAESEKRLNSGSRVV